MLLEMHCHTAEHSDCSTVSAAELVQRNFDNGLQGTVLTDHHYLWPDDEIRELRRQLQVPDYYVILSGQEVSTPEFGDVLVYGADVSIDRGTDLNLIRRRFPEAAVIWAHPYRREQIPDTGSLLNPLIDGVEILNSNHTIAESSRGLGDWHRLKFTAVAGTDTHALSYSGTYPTLFDHPVSSASDLAREIKAGRCRPFLQEIPRSGTSNVLVTEITMGPGEKEKYILKKHENIESWRSAARSASVVAELARHGFREGRFRVPNPLGEDRENLTLIEQGIKGKSLFDKLLPARPAEGAEYLEMAAEWLARLHNLGLQITPPSEFLSDEPLRLERYLSAFYKIKHPHTRKAQEIMDRVIETENGLYCRHPEKMVQGHGDFHPRNIFIGQDSENPESRFVAAIDFDSSYTMPPAFDVGTFIAQFQNQFYNEKEVLANLSEDIFLNKYMNTAKYLERDFLREVELFRARTSLSISYYLIKVGLGESENLWRVLVLAEQGLARLSL